MVASLSGIVTKLTATIAILSRVCRQVFGRDIRDMPIACARTHPDANKHARHTVYPKKYAHGFCFAVLCCGYTLTDFPISIRLTSLALWQSNDCPSASKATLMNMDKYFMWIHYERLHDHNKAKHNKTVCIFLGIYCTDRCIWHMQTSAPLVRLHRVTHWSLNKMDAILRVIFSFSWQNFLNYI